MTTIEDLNKKLDEILELFHCQKTEHNQQLNEALSKAQAEMDIATASKLNKYYQDHFADLADVVKASRPALTKYGLSVTQSTSRNDEGQTILTTTLRHCSGQSIASEMVITPPKSDLRTLNSHMTMLKRIAYGNITGVVCYGDDDDAEISTDIYRTKQNLKPQVTKKYDPREESYEVISKEQLEELEYELEEFPDIIDDIYDGLNITSLADMPKSKYRNSINRIRRIKAVRKGEVA